MSNSFNVVILISGNGSNLQAIIDAQLPISIRAVISNRPDAYGLRRAEKAHIPIEVVPHQAFPSRQAFEEALSDKIDRYEPHLIVLAGFMRTLGSTFVKNYYGKMINIHPSLLPKYPGLGTHKRVLANRETEHGITIHFVSEEVDGGPIICQARLKIPENITETALSDQIHTLEHTTYPQVIQWVAENRLELRGKSVLLDGHKLNKSGKQIITNSFQ